MAPATTRGSARQLLIEAARARFAEQGALAATLEEIRAEAGVSAGALYHHFADKRELAGALYIETLGHFQDRFSATLDRHQGAEPGIRAGVGEVLDWCLGNRAEARLLFEGRAAADPAALAELNRDFFQRTRRWYGAHAHYGTVRDLPLPVVSALWLGPSFELLRNEPDRIDRATRRALCDGAWRSLGEEPR